MDFAIDKNLTFEQATELFFKKLGVSKIMAVATSGEMWTYCRDMGWMPRFAMASRTPDDVP